MAAAADRSSKIDVIRSMTLEERQSLMNNIIRTTINQFQWHAKHANANAFRDLLEKKAFEIAELRLDNMETLTIEMTMEITHNIAQLEKYVPVSYSSIKPFGGAHYNEMPFIVHFPKEGECSKFPLFEKFPWIIFRTSASRFPDVIPHEYFDIIKYLGVVIVFITDKFNKKIPFLPDNIIHIELAKSFKPLSLPEFRFPKFLQSYYDYSHPQNYCPPKTERYTHGLINMLPPTVRIIKTHEELFDNPPQNLKDFDYSGKAIISKKECKSPNINFELLPSNMNSIVIHYAYLDKPVIHCPSGTNLLSISLGTILDSYFTVLNVKTLIIREWDHSVKICPNDNTLVNTSQYLKKKYTNFCDNCTNRKMCFYYYSQKIEFIIDEHLEHLILHQGMVLEILNCIANVPSNFKKITIIIDSLFTILENTMEKNIAKYKKMMEEKELLTIAYTLNPSNKEALSDKLYIEGKIEELQNIIDFHQRFPHIIIEFLPQTLISDDMDRYVY